VPAAFLSDGAYLSVIEPRISFCGAIILALLRIFESRQRSGVLAIAQSADKRAHIALRVLERGEIALDHESRCDIPNLLCEGALTFG